MKESKYDSLLQPLMKRPFFTAKEARGTGIPSRMLAHFCDQGMIERMSRGFYRVREATLNIDIEFEELVILASSIPKGVVCLISALCYYKLTDQIMREYWIAVPNSEKKPIRPHARIVRLRNMELGQTKVHIGNYEMKIFDRERTVIDAFRFLSDEIAIKALKMYMTGTDRPDLAKLMHYAKALRMNITPYLTVLTT